MINLGLIGCGYWGKKYLGAASDSQALSLTRVCDSDTAIAAELAAAYPGKVFTSSLDSLWADPGIAGVIIATPAATHFELARQALQAGKDVLLEKPMVLSSVQALQLKELARHYNKILMVAHIYAYHPVIRRLKELLSQNTFGALSYITSIRTTLGPVRKDINAAWDMGVHDLSILLQLCDGLPEAVSAQGLSAEGQAESAVFFQLWYPSYIAAVQVSWCNPRRIRELMLVGSQRTAVFDETAAPWELKCFKQGLANQPQAFKHQIPCLRDTVESLRVTPAMPLTVMMEHFAGCVQTRQQPMTGVEAGLKAVRVLEQISLSLQAGGKRIPLEER